MTWPPCHNYLSSTLGCIVGCRSGCAPVVSWARPESIRGPSEGRHPPKLVAKTKYAIGCAGEYSAVKVNLHLEARTVSRIAKGPDRNRTIIIKRLFWQTLFFQKRLSCQSRRIKSRRMSIMSTKLLVSHIGARKRSDGSIIIKVTNPWDFFMWFSYINAIFVGLFCRVWKTSGLGKSEASYCRQKMPETCEITWVHGVYCTDSFSLILMCKG